MAASEAALLQQAVAFHREGKIASAQRRYQDVLKINPRNFDALRLLGVVEFQRGNHRVARRLLTDAIRLAPQIADSHYFLGRCLSENGELAEAVAAYEAALACEPRHDNADIALAHALTGLGRLDAALARLDGIIARNPSQRDALYNRAGLLRREGRYDDALADFDRTLAVDPSFMPARRERGELLLFAGRSAEAAEDFALCLGAEPASVEVRANLALAQLQVADPRAIRANADLPDAARRERRPLPLSLLLAFGAAPADILANARYQAAKSPRPAEPWRAPAAGDRRIRIAYLSSDFREHPVAYVTAGLFEHHDRARFDVMCVSTAPLKADAMTARIRSAVPDFVDIGHLADADAVQALRQREIDITIDLNGYTSLGRPAVLVARVAPVQVNYLGYPATMGASFMDYIVGDRFVTPPEADAHFAEKIVSLPGCYLATDNRRGIAAQTPDRLAAGLPAQGFVFAAFTAPFKITPEVFAVWMRLVRAVEHSVLWLGAMEKTARDNLLRQAAAHGVAPERLVFAPRVPSNADHLARHRLADLFLDTAPYNGHSTAADALWAGLPVVTCMGAIFAGRVGASLLHAAGLAELVAPSLAEYEALALQLATQPERLAELKARLVAQRDGCALFDTPRYARNIEKAFAEMHRRRVAGLAPDRIAVAD